MSVRTPFPPSPRPFRPPTKAQREKRWAAAKAAVAQDFFDGDEDRATSALHALPYSCIPDWDDLRTTLEVLEFIDLIDHRAATDDDSLSEEERVSPPQRIQRKRTKGWRMPEGAVYVGRPTEWGNPWEAGDVIAVEWDSTETTRTYRELLATPELVVSLYRIAFTPDADEIRGELAGRDLACWCPLDQPCHADVLLEIANGETS